MEKTFWQLLTRTVFCLALTAVLNGCSQAAPAFYVLAGNYRYEQGRYQDAVSNYFSALEYGVQENAVFYNLGAAYNALGESYPALEMWSLSEKEGPKELKSRSLLNQGTVYYSMGRYDQAVEAFKRALEINASDLNAKINLELALNKRKEAQDSAASSAPSEAKRQSDQQVNRTLDYLRRRESFFWGRAEEEVWDKEENDW